MEGFTNTASASPSYGGGTSSFGSTAGASGIDALSTFMAQLGDYNFGKASADYNFDLNKQMSDYQFAKNLEMWNLANEYNSPKAQMRRFEEAGLNPNLVYGQGTPGNAGTIPRYEAPRREAVGIGPTRLPSAVESLQAYYNLEMQKKQMSMIDVNMELAKKRTLTEDANANLKTLMGVYQEGKNRMQSIYEGYYPDTLKVGLQKSQAELANKIQTFGLLKADELLKNQALQNMKADYNLKGLTGQQKLFEIGLNRIGATRTDNVLLRALATPLENMKNGISGWYDKYIAPYKWTPKWMNQDTVRRRK